MAEAVRRSEAAEAGSLLVPGDTCWRVARADRVAVLIDAESYYAALADALERAQRSILLLGWDLHGGVLLRRGEGAGDCPPLVDLLDGLVRQRRGLHAHVLEWDYALLYALERQILPTVRFGWRTHRRLHFQLDAEHPLGGSQHQKMVVIDDRIAFCGGIDVTMCRWDTREHRADDPRRCDPGAKDYNAFHDAQLLVDGDAAAALGALARERWRRATGQHLHARRGDADPWPPGIEPAFREVPVGIARTEPAWGGRREVREVERLYVAAIRAARRSIYIENQYLTAGAVGDALAARLAEPDGPDVVMVSTGTCEGWLEEQTMGVLRSRWLARLRAADRHDRLRALHPVVPGLDPNSFTVHAKVMVVDDQLLRVGSANLSNRSMGLDSECDLAIEALGDPDRARAIAFVRDDLLAEHLGATPERVAEALRTHGSLVAAVDALRGGPRTLAPLSDEVDPHVDELVPDAAVLDPEKPVGPDELMARLLPELGPSAGLGVGRALLATAFVALALGVAWRWTPLAEWAAPERMAALVAPLRAHPLGAPLVAAAIAAASLVFVPIPAMTVAAALALGPVWGFLAAFAGAMASALAGFAIGRWAWGDAVRRVLGRRLRRLRVQLAGRGLAAMAALRIVPVAPFTLVNLAAGASSIDLRAYLLGTAFALAPLTGAIVLVADRARRAFVDPTFWTFAALSALLAAAWLALAWARRRVAPRPASRA